MWDEIAGAYGSRFFLAAGGVGIALLLLIGILWIFRNRAPSPFVRGGKTANLACRCLTPLPSTLAAVSCWYGAMALNTLS